MTILANKTEIVSIDTIKGYTKNPRIGDIGAIMDSLEENRQYRPIVVQKSTGMILAGNHTWQAAKRLGWEEIAVTYIDVNDEQAKRIVLADNRTNDLASYDAKQLTELLESLPDVSGTGYSTEDLDVLLSTIESNDMDDVLIDSVIHPASIRTVTREQEEIDELEDEATSGGAVGGISRPNFTEDEDIRDVASTQTAPTVQDELEDVRFDLEQYEGEIWATRSGWGIPMLSRKMLLDEMPPNLDTWIGASRHSREEIDDDSIHWIYNYSVGTAAVPYDRSIMSFYIHDDKFENWWHLPAYYVARFTVAGINRGINPDFSMWSNWPLTLSLYNVYRNFWLGRFMQQAGWKVIPNISFSTPDSYSFAWDGIPVEPPIASIQLQTVSKDKKSEWNAAIQGLTEALKVVKPQALIVYAGDPGIELAEAVIAKHAIKPEIVPVKSFSRKLTELGVYEREKPSGTKRSMAGFKPSEDEDDE